MQIADTYRGHPIEAHAVRHRGKWGFDYRVHDFPKPGRTFGSTSFATLFETESEAIGAALSASRDELDTFAHLTEIEASPV
jgi:hypothetical protein